MASRCHHDAGLRRLGGDSVSQCRESAGTWVPRYETFSSQTCCDEAPRGLGDIRTASHSTDAEPKTPLHPSRPVYGRPGFSDCPSRATLDSTPRGLHVPAKRCPRLQLCASSSLTCQGPHVARPEHGAWPQYDAGGLKGAWLADVWFGAACPVDSVESPQTIPSFETRSIRLPRARTPT